MGNIVVIDMGNIVMRIAIIDYDDILQQLIHKHGVEQQWALIDQSFPFEQSSGFNLEMTITLPSSQGRIYFLRFNIIESNMHISNVNTICEFFQKAFQSMKNVTSQLNLDDESLSPINEFKYPTLYSNVPVSATNFLKQIAERVPISKEHYYLSSTGGYNDYYLKQISETFNVYIKKNHHYVESLIVAIDFLNRSTSECFFKSEKTAHGHNLLSEVEGPPPKYHLQPTYFSVDNIYPYLLVLVRSGTTIHRVDSYSKSIKVGSSVIGGATFLGLLRTLTKYTDPEKATSDATYGNNLEIDLSVGDIYGGGEESIGLKAGIIASSFAKASKLSEERISALKDKDIARSLLSMIIINILQIASLYAQMEGLERIIIVGTKFMSIELAESMEV
jgi:pantothenate kinase